MRRLAWLLGIALLGSALTKWIVVSMAAEERPIECSPSAGPDGYAVRCEWR